MSGPSDPLSVDVEPVAISVNKIQPEECSPEDQSFTGRIVLAVIPAYNEERFIGSVVLKAKRCVHHVIVVDDGSSDTTSRIAADAGAEVVRHEENRGKGAALATGFLHARAHKPGAVVMLDADGQHRPEEIHQVIKPVLMGQADIVIGSRYLDDRSSVPRHRVWGHRFFNLLTSSASGVAALPADR